MNKLVLIFFSPLQYVHLKKDVGLFPIYFKQFYFDKVELLCFEKENAIPETFRNIEIKQITAKTFKKENTSRIIDLYSNIQKIHILLRYIKNDKNITHIMMFHAMLEHLILCKKIKKRFPSIKTYIKFDTDFDGCQQFSLSQNKIFKFIRYKTIPYVDLFTAETESSVNVLQKNPIIKNKIYYIPNGYDDELLHDIDLSKKQKQIITVGRLGTFQKNTELFLDIISKLNLKDWKIKLIGPIEPSFVPKITKFYEDYPQLRNQVTFTGNITDINEMLHIYENSSVFILTSRAEGSALVILESAINGDYILSTDVGAIRQISTDKDFCFIASHSNKNNQDEDIIKEEMIKHLQLIINGEFALDKLQQQIEYCKQNFLMSNIIQSECFTTWCSN